ncbi:META domain-containing protein [Sulfitobacter noctilucicola]|nr:META domain-containing protein [Sulfitobacter noctilucicola]
MLTLFQRDETLRSYGGAGHEWQLIEMNGDTFDGQATLTFPTRNVIAGRGPCNSYQSRNAVPFPWFGAEPIRSTRMACPSLAQETEFFNALQAATIAKVTDGLLVLSNDETDLLVFKAGD